MVRAKCRRRPAGGAGTGRRLRRTEVAGGFEGDDRRAAEISAARRRLSLNVIARHCRDGRGWDEGRIYDHGPVLQKGVKCYEISGRFLVLDAWYGGRRRCGSGFLLIYMSKNQGCEAN